MKTIVAILPSTVLYGKERSNIEVYQLIKNHTDNKIVIIANKKASDKIKNYLSDFKVYYIHTPNRHHKKFNLLLYTLEFLYYNIKVAYILLSENSKHLFLNSEISFYDLFITLSITRSRILYRIGDAPSYPKLKNFKINSKLWEKLVCKKVHTIVSISQYIKNCVKNTGRSSQNDTIIYNYPPNRKEKEIQEAIKLPQKTESQITFGYLGQITEEKGVMHLINSAKKIHKEHPNAKFIIAGNLNYDTTFKKAILQTINKEDNSFISLIGEIDYIKDFFNYIDILCVPSIKQEPLGNVIVEAKKYSTPCIIYPTGGMPELIQHLEDGYICPSATEEELSKALLYYIANPSIINKQSINSNQSIEKLSISYKHYQSKWLNVLNKFTNDI